MVYLYLQYVSYLYLQYVSYLYLQHVSYLCLQHVSSIFWMPVSLILVFNQFKASKFPNRATHLILVRWILVIDHFHVHVHRKIMIDRYKKETISSTSHSLLIFRDLFQISLLELSKITNQLSSIPPENFWFSDDFRENRSYSIRLILEVKSADFLILVVTRQADQKYIQPEIFRHDIMN